MLADKKKYMPRLLDSMVDIYLNVFGAVEVAGTMWSGKTWTALRHGNSEVNLDVPQMRKLAELDPYAVLSGEKPHIIDEWQEVPAVWDAVRRRIDEAAGEHGLYILTGSSQPAHDKTMHSGAGRIARLKMWPLSLQESGNSSGSVSLKELFDGQFKPNTCSTSLERLATFICRGGWPASIDMQEKDALLVPRQYVDAVLNSESAHAPAKPQELKRLLVSVARTIGSPVTLKTIAADMGLALDKSNEDTSTRHVSACIDHFLNCYLLCDLPGWDAPIKSPRRLRIKPKHGFADPSIPSALLGVNPEKLLMDMQLFGQLFEELCLRDLRVYTSVLEDAHPDSLRYYRDSDGLEVDAIIELRDGRWGAIEIKLGDAKIKEAEKNLLRLKKKIAENPRARNLEPSFLMALVGKAEMTYKLPSGVHVVPITELGA